MAKPANLLPIMRIARAGTRILGEDDSAGPIFPVETVSKFEPMGSALRRAIFAGESSGPERLEIDLPAGKADEPPKIDPFTIPRDWLSPSP